MDWLDALALGTGGVYCTAVLWLWFGLGRRGSLRRDYRPAVSVVVAARNEAENITACLQALSRLQYDGALEIIVVDDRSTDDTAELVRTQIGAGPVPLRLVQAPPSPQFRCPKKSALACGIAASTGELLLFTDADCQPPPDWVLSMVSHFEPEVGLVAGYSFQRRGRRWRQGLLELDNAAVAALGAGSMGMGRPLSCTGRNLAYRRRVYDEVGGFAPVGHLIGGDDVYFMRLVAQRSAWRAVFNQQGGAVPCQPAPEAWGAIAQQKLRHAAKGGHYSGPALALGAAVYLFHAALLAGLIDMLWSGALRPWVLGIWGLRWAVDAALLVRFLRRRSQWYLLFFWPLLEILYIPYVLFFTALGRLGWFRWK